MSLHPKSPPYLVYSDLDGNIYENTDYLALGRSAWDITTIALEDWIELPEGGSLYMLPDRKPLGLPVDGDRPESLDSGLAVAAFIPPAYTGFHVAAYENCEDAQTLSLFCYTAVGWLDNKFYVPARRIEKDIRQDAKVFDEAKIEEGVQIKLQNYPDNRLVQHLAHNCYERYNCPAARNFFMSRWECPIPVSPACNANCVGCISLQEDEEEIVSPQDRLQFKPSAEEISEYTVPHLMTAPYAIVSFGQGCEGEPLLMHDTITKSISEMRKHTDRGSININTNGSKPEALEAMMDAGLNSVRISTNSVQERIYTPYYRPNNYEWKDVVESAKRVKAKGGWVSINYFVFPGVTDSISEYEALREFIRETDIDMIQWRNLNIDPDWYLAKIYWIQQEECIGIPNLMDRIQEEFPHIKYGYFNPSMERMKDYDNVPS